MNVLVRVWVPTFLAAVIGPLSAVASGTPAAGATVPNATAESAHDYSWQQTDGYAPPSFASYFPDSAAGADALRDRWRAQDWDGFSDYEIIETARMGLRRFDGDRTAVLRWLGKRYIWKQSPQHPAAIELMYHASDTTASGRGAGDAVSPAIYFGLAVVEPKPPAVLRALVSVAMASDNPNDLSRIAWGVNGQLAPALEQLERYRQSADAAEREKAEVLARILKRELKAFDWAREQQRAQVEVRYRNAVPQLLDGLRRGDSAQRRELLTAVSDEDLMLILGDTAIAAFAACADDPDPAVRRLAAKLAGQHWIWSAPEPLPEAVDLMMDLSRDPDNRTRYNAVYFGLSTIPRKEKAVIRQLIEIALGNCEAELYDRIAWGLRGQRAEVRALLHEYLASADPGTVAAAEGAFEDLGGLALH